MPVRKPVYQKPDGTSEEVATTDSVQLDSVALTGGEVTGLPATPTGGTAAGSKTYIDNQDAATLAAAGVAADAADVVVLAAAAVAADAGDVTTLATANAYADSVGVPAATQKGEVLFSVDGVSFEVKLPITTKNGWLCNNDGLLLVVG